MAQIELTKTHMLIKVTKAEQIWSIHGDLKIPAALIKGSEVAHKDIWRSIQPAITIDLPTADGQRFKRLVISTDNPQALVDEINEALVAC